MKADILYFAMLKDAVGRDRETVELPDTVVTVSDLLDFLAARGEPFASALANRKRVRCALDQEMAFPASDIRKASEIALFPPVTGG